MVGIAVECRNDDPMVKGAAGCCGCDEGGQRQHGDSAGPDRSSGDVCEIGDGVQPARALRCGVAVEHKRHRRQANADHPAKSKAVIPHMFPGVSVWLIRCPLWWWRSAVTAADGRELASGADRSCLALDEPHPLEMTTLDVGQILDDLASDVSAIQPERIVEVDAPEGLTIEGDRDQLIQALMETTANALRYTPTDTPLVFRGLARGRSVRLEIEDQGPGIAPADAERLFERFYRVDGSRNRSTGGNGLGLAIVASIITAHNGTHGVSETPGGGATFWMEIPSRPNSESTATSRPLLSPVSTPAASATSPDP